MYRSNHGCWTCRVRRKKCDEALPLCRACTSRNIQCHGYGDRPEWMDGGAQEKLELAKIKKAVHKNFLKGIREKQRSQQPRTPSSAATQSLSPAASPQQNGNIDSNSSLCHHRISALEIEDSTSAPELTRYSAHSRAIFFGSKIISLPESEHHSGISSCRPAEIYTPIFAKDSLDSVCRSATHFSGNIVNYREADLLMHYIDYVFPLQFRFHTPNLKAGGRGWLLWLLAKNGPLYHAALSLSALHQYISLAHGMGEIYTELTEYHTKALQDLQLFLQHIQGSVITDERSRQIEVLACGVSLISFELFQGGVSDWHLHLNALISIIESSKSRPMHDLLTDSTLNKSRLGGLLSWQNTALSFLTGAVLWFDLLSCTSTGEAPSMPYQSLLDSDVVDMESIMGCQNWVMRAIGDLASLSAWKDDASQKGVLSMRELVSQSQKIEERLEQGLKDLDQRDPASSLDHHLRAKSVSQTTQTVTRIFGTSALVQLHTIVSGAYPSVPEIRNAVSRNIAAIEAITDPQAIRGLIWPICISASMAEPDKESFYEATVKSALGESHREFGNCATLLQITRKCWEMRKLNSHREFNWKSAMEKLGICLLLV